MGSPSIVILKGGAYVATHDLFGPGSTQNTSAVTRVFRSEDRGRTWRQTAEFSDQFWSNLFVHRGRLYLMGCTYEYGRPVIRSSRDGGRTWSAPSALSEEAGCHTAPVPVAEWKGRIWRTYEWHPPGPWGHFQALVASANLADRYIADRFLPDKAIDLIDEAGSRLRIKRMETPADYKEIENELSGVVEAKKKAVEAQDFEEAGRLRDKEKELLAAKDAKEREIKDSGVDLFDEVDEEAIAEVLSMWTGIPVYKLTEEETQKLLRMEDELHKRVIGQQDAIKAVSQAVRRTRAGLKDPKRPSGSFIFLGPSGVGKTELAKTLAEFLFGDENAMISLDMSEYMEKHTVSRLVGSPPGYVGYEEGGQLTEAVRRKPFSVVLFDEIEKAHPDVFNTLLQILEEGRLTDAQGRSVDFRNTVLIMTSNLGTADLRKAALGFGRADEAVSYEKMKEKVNEALKQHFRPEFLNRIDETIVFHELSKDEVTQIVDLMIARTQKQLEGQGVGLELLPAAKAHLADKGYDPEYGARPLRRLIQNEIEDELSDGILSGKFKLAGVVRVNAVDGELVLESVEEDEPLEAPGV